MIPFTLKGLEIVEAEGLNLQLSSKTFFRERAKAIFLAVQYVESYDVEGDIVEFGVFGGESAAVIAASIKYQESKAPLDRKIAAGQVQPKYLYLFDSFEGYPEFETEVDTDSPDHLRGRFYPGGHNIDDSTPETFAREATKAARMFLGDDKVRICPGFFQESVPKNIGPTQKFSLARFDCDLYQSTLEALDHLFAVDAMTDGSVLMFDGWSCNRSSNDYGMRRAWRETLEKHDIDYEDCGEYAGLCRKFLIHK